MCAGNQSQSGEQRNTLRLRVVEPFCFNRDAGEEAAPRSWSVTTTVSALPSPLSSKTKVPGVCLVLLAGVSSFYLFQG